MKITPPRWAALLIPALLVSACGSGAASMNRQDDTLGIALSTDVSTLNPWMTKTVPTDLSVISQIYESLTVRDPDMSIKPLLAESWTQPAPNTWKFTLRSDVKFSNGDPFDSSVVKWNIEQVKKPETKARIATNIAQISSVETPDAKTVTIKTKGADTTMPALMSSFFLVDPKWAVGHDLATQPVGTGPYTLDKWEKNSLLQLKARSSYWGKKPSFGTVDYKVLPEPSAQIAALQTGDVEFLTGVGPDQMAQVQAIPDIDAGSIPTARSVFLMFNTKKEPLNDVRIRQALNYAVDKDSIVKSLFHGLTNPSNGSILTKEYVGFDASLSEYSYNPAKAKELLASAGYSKGLSLTLSYPSSTYFLADQVTQVLKEQLAQVGVTVNVQPEPFASWLSNMYAGKLADAAYVTYSWPTLDGAELLQNFGPGGAQSFWNDPSFGAALNDARQTADTAAHVSAIKQAQHIARDQAPFLFLYPQPLTYAHAKSLQWTPRPDDWVRAYDISKD